MLLLILSSCLCAATFVVNVTQSSYEAEENHSITLEWTFTTRTQGSWKNLFIICEFRTSVKSGVIYVHHDGDEFPDSQDDQFSGRVQSDKDVLREGRIRLHVSRLRTEDSGLYRCNMKTEDGFNSGRCRLNVTAAADQIQTQRPTLTSEPERGRWTIIVIIALGVISAAALMFLLCYLVVKCCLPVDVYYSDAKETRDFNPLIV
uniref:Immunoglobulin domain-containing protein n=1 Tax=Poecilia formosa TaxID=48698 RepID=A0A087XHX0_POEFO